MSKVWPCLLVWIPQFSSTGPYFWTGERQGLPYQHLCPVFPSLPSPTPSAPPAISLVALSALFLWSGAAAPNPALVIACVVAFVGGYQVGFGPITWLILSEIFPLEIRSAAVSLGTLANFSSAQPVPRWTTRENILSREGLPLEPQADNLMARHT